MNKFLQYKNLLRICIIFFVGLLVRFLINEYLLVNVFTDYWNYISILFYVLFSAFIFWVNHCCDNMFMLSEVDLTYLFKGSSEKNITISNICMSEDENIGSGDKLNQYVREHESKFRQFCYTYSTSLSLTHSDIQYYNNEMSKKLLERQSLINVIYNTLPAKAAEFYILYLGNDGNTETSPYLRIKNKYR